MQVLVHPGPDTRVELSGELDVASGGELKDAVRGAVEGGAESVVVDLGAVSFMDSLGLAALLSAARSAGSGGARFSVTSPHGSEARLLIELSGVDGALGLQA